VRKCRRRRGRFGDEAGVGNANGVEYDIGRQSAVYGCIAANFRLARANRIDRRSGVGAILDSRRNEDHLGLTGKRNEGQVTAELNASWYALGLGVG
jgi:hypothetical protein